ncbi:MAG: hypothetical protein JWO13_2254 [Acidobacteriales bacterium]|nr:hypothetical protein [Terriglobales bacterium]
MHFNGGNTLRRTISTLAVLWLSLFFANVCTAQTTTAFDANLAQLAGGDVSNYRVGLSVKNCSNYLLRLSGPSISVGDTAYLTPDGNGLVSAPVPDEAAIGCGSTPSSAFYTVSIVEWNSSTQRPILPARRQNDYDITGPTFHLNTATPRTAPAPASIANAMLLNASGDQTAVIQSGKKIAFAGGTVDFTGTTLTGVSGTGIASLNGLTVTTQTFANDANLQISSIGAMHTLTWAGALAKARQNAQTAYLDGNQTFTGNNIFNAGTFTVGVTSGFSTLGGTYIARNIHNIAKLNGSTSKYALLGVQWQDNTGFPLIGIDTMVEATNTGFNPGGKGSVIGHVVDAFNTGGGETTFLSAISATSDNENGLADTQNTLSAQLKIGASGFSTIASVLAIGAQVPAGQATILTGLDIAAITGGSVNFAIKTDLGTVSFGDNVLVQGHSVTADTFVGALTGNASTASALASAPSLCGAGNYARGILANGAATGCTPSSGSGTVTSFSAGALAPLFTTNVATATSTPALSFTLSNFAAHKFYGNNTGGTAAPDAESITAADLPSLPESQITNLTTDLGAKEATANKDAVSGYAGLTAGTKLKLAEGQEVWGVADLSDFASKSGTGTAAIGATITSPAVNDLLQWDGAKWINTATISAATQLSGTLASAQMPSLTGDITNVGLATTLKSTGSAGTYTKVTFDAQGRETSGATAQFSDIGGSVAGSQMPALSGAVTSSAGSTVTSAGKADVIDAPNFCQAAGANTTTYTCSLSPAISAYVTGTHYRFKADVANTAASTVSFNSVGAKTIKKAAGGVTTDIVANDLRAGQWVDLVYDGTNMQMQSTLGNAASGSTPGVTFMTFARTGVNNMPPADTTHIRFIGIPNLEDLTFTQMTVNIAVVDASNNYALGIYEDVSGTMTNVCGTTPQVFNSLNAVTLTCSGTTTRGRRHYLGISGAAVTMKIDRDSALGNFLGMTNSSVTVTGGAALGGTAGTTPANSASTNTGVPVLVLN